jgi:hypothetical protein
MRAHKIQNNLKKKPKSFLQCMELYCLFCEDEKWMTGEWRTEKEEVAPNSRTLHQYIHLQTKFYKSLSRKKYKFYRLLQFLSSRKFKIHTHFILSFKIMYLNSWGQSVLPQHVAYTEKANKMCCFCGNKYVNFNNIPQTDQFFTKKQITSI